MSTRLRRLSATYKKPASPTAIPNGASKSRAVGSVGASPETKSAWPKTRTAPRPEDAEASYSSTRLLPVSETKMRSPGPISTSVGLFIDPALMNAEVRVKKTLCPRTRSAATAPFWSYGRRNRSTRLLEESATNKSPPGVSARPRGVSRLDALGPVKPRFGSASKKSGWPITKSAGAPLSKRNEVLHPKTR